MKFSRKPFNRDADCECVARTHKVTAREVVDYVASRTGGRGGGRGVCLFVLRGGSRAMDTYYEGGDEMRCQLAGG